VYKDVAMMMMMMMMMMMNSFSGITVTIGGGFKSP